MYNIDLWFVADKKSSTSLTCVKEYEYDPKTNELRYRYSGDKDWRKLSNVVGVYAYSERYYIPAD